MINFEYLKRKVEKQRFYNEVPINVINDQTVPFLDLKHHITKLQGPHPHPGCHGNVYLCLTVPQESAVRL